VLAVDFVESLPSFDCLLIIQVLNNNSNKNKNKKIQYLKNVANSFFLINLFLKLLVILFF
jgi:hypothetical protein